MFSGNDRFVDLSLRILTGVIVTAMATAVILLASSSLRSAAQESAPIPLVVLEPKPVGDAERTTPAPRAQAEVLFNPGRIYRCVIKGRTTFSERPCPGERADSPAGR